MTVHDLLSRYSQDAKFFEAHREDILREHPDEWVAIFDEKIVGASANFNELLDQLQGKGFAAEETFIEYATSRDELLILRA